MRYRPFPTPPFFLRARPFFALRDAPCVRSARAADENSARDVRAARVVRHDALDVSRELCWEYECLYICKSYARGGPSARQCARPDIQVKHVNSN